MKKISNILIGFGYFLIIGVYGYVGAWSIDTILSWFGKDIPFVGDFVAGLFLGYLSIEVAIIGNILRLFSVF